MQYKLFLDLDGVLADFVGSACKILNWNRENWKKHSIKEQNDIFNITEEKFWKSLLGKDNSLKSEYFWYTLSKTPEFDDLISIDPNFTILTNCPKFSTHFSAAGKILWMKKHFGEDFSRFKICGGVKEDLAKPNHILIDDSDENIKKWNEAGGWGMVWKQPWNKGKTSHENMLVILKEVFNG